MLSLSKGLKNGSPMPITKRKISYNLDLQDDLDGLSKKEKTDAKRRIAEYILSEIENHTQAGVSPVTGGEFKRLSKNYAKRKKKLVGNSDPDLHLHDKMINSIRAEIKQESIDFRITEEKPKAFNHLVGDTLPKRQFLPNDEDTKGRAVGFNRTIKDGITEIIKEINADKG